MGLPQTRLLLKASLIAKVHTVDAFDAGLRDRHTDGFAFFVDAGIVAKVHTVHTVDAGLRDRHTDGFAPDKAFSNSKLNS